MELCIETGVDDYELRSTVDGCPLSPQAEGQVLCVVWCVAVCGGVEWCCIMLSNEDSQLQNINNYSTCSVTNNQKYSYNSLVLL